MGTTIIRIFWVLGLALLLLLPLTLLLQWGFWTPASAQETEAKAQYIGSMKCAKVCHKTAKQGQQLKIWQASEHAKAFETLGTPEAKKIAAEKGIADPQTAEACLKCHVTAAGASDDLKGTKYSDAEGVGCERCHGPGSLYKKRSTMKDRAKSVAAGLLLPDEKTCLGCHNEESPTYEAFNYEEFQKKIAHPKPEPKG
ncbi:MAG: cytochrome c family protein [Candidatus Latescibacteria bacterium]|jgi:hypothetical protein|nr:cytochrome c family protein [Candidatus Latescibacterota bacterium]